MYGFGLMQLIFIHTIRHKNKFAIFHIHLIVKPKYIEKSRFVYERSYANEWP